MNIWERRKKVKTVEESVTASLDGGNDIEIFEFFPYILQDIRELGTSPEAVLQLVKKNTKNHEDLRVLDLGCGKGAVSILLSRILKCFCLGIDAVGEFIREAQVKAEECHADMFCRFITGDIRKEIRYLKGFDIIILGATGPVFGSCYDTLSSLADSVKSGGILIVDDGYIPEESDFKYPHAMKKSEILSDISRAGWSLLDETVFSRDMIKDSDDFIFSSIRKRCLELAEKYPGKSDVFLGYIKRQEEENDILENRLICSLMVIKKL